MQSTGVSVIVPFYNEQGRMAPFVTDLISYASARFDVYEIIFVNDGSKDKSVERLSALIKGAENCSIVSYSPNKGKGHAVKIGVEKASGEKIVFADIDGSTKPQYISDVLNALDNADAAVGERRSGLKSVKQPFYRSFIRMLFNFYVNLLFDINVSDSLCGLKGFRRDVAKKLFKDLYSQRWIFDVEILYKARRMGFNIVEIPVEWDYRPGSRIKPIDPALIFVQLLMLRIKCTI